jgi:fatty-acyl-CoA synthase
MREYWQNPAASSAAFHGGWFRTGDAGSLDEHETLTLVERIKEIIIVGGRNVYPADVEAVLERCPEVAEAAVVASPHVDLGEVPAAFVVLKPDRTLSADEIRRLFDGQLADYKHPHQIAFVDALPRTAAGKVAKAQLRQALLGAVAGRADTE